MLIFVGLCWDYGRAEFDVTLAGKSYPQANASFWRIFKISLKTQF